jgi:hypothetical protein
MIENNVTATATAAVWEHLVDDLNATASYRAVRAYVAKRLSRLAEAGQVPLTLAR